MVKTSDLSLSLSGSRGVRGSRRRCTRAACCSQRGDGRNEEAAGRAWLLQKYDRGLPRLRPGRAARRRDDGHGIDHGRNEYDPSIRIRPAACFHCGRSLFGLQRIGALRTLRLSCRGTVRRPTRRRSRLTQTGVRASRSTSHAACHARSAARRASGSRASAASAYAVIFAATQAARAARAASRA